MSFSELNNIQSLCLLSVVLRNINCFTRQCFIGRGRLTSHLSIIMLILSFDFIHIISIPAKIFRNLKFFQTSLPALCSKLIAQLIIRLPMRLPAPCALLSPPSAMFLPKIPSVFISFLSRPVSRLNSKR